MCSCRCSSRWRGQDLVIFAVSDYRIELLFDEVVKAKIPAAVIFSSLNIDDDNNPNLKARIKGKILKSNMMVCGANGMGFYNIRDHVWACGFDSNDHSAPGNISLISHSGSGMSGILDCEDRLRVLAEDGSHIKYSDGKISGVSDEDEESFNKFHKRMTKFGALLKTYLNKRPARLGTKNSKDLLLLAKLGFDIRRMGKTEMREFLRLSR